MSNCNIESMLKSRIKERLQEHWIENIRVGEQPGGEDVINAFNEYIDLLADEAVAAYLEGDEL